MKNSILQKYRPFINENLMCEDIDFSSPHKLEVE